MAAHCSACGSEVMEGSAFCSSCGAKIGQPVADPANNRAAGVPSVDRPLTAQARQSPRKLLFTIVTLVIIIGLIAVAGVYLKAQTERAETYEAAMLSMQSGDYETAIQLLYRVRGFKDTDAKIDEARELLSESRVAEVDAMIAQLGEESVLSEILDYGQLVTDAVDAYNELTEEEKGRVGGLGVLEVAQVFYFVADGNQGTALGIIQQSTAMSDEQVMRCLRKYAIYTSIDDVLSELKGMMKNPAAFEWESWTAPLGVHRSPQDGATENDYSITFNVTYSGTNSFGGRLQDTSMAIVYCTIDPAARRVTVTDILII